MSKKIIIKIGFNSYFNKNRSSEEWIKNRIDLFTNYTLKSIKSQTNQDFLVLVYCAEETMPLINKYLSKYEKLPSNVIFSDTDTCDKILEDSIKNYDYLYLARIDSDDLYHKTYIDELYNYEPQSETEVLINQKGYLYDVVNNILATWYHISPPFYTLIYKTTNYLSGKRYHLEGGHGGAIKLKHEIFQSRNFIYLRHNKNLSPQKIAKEKSIVEQKEVKNVLKQFGL